MRIVSAVTPRAVAPPLSPSKGCEALRSEERLHLHEAGLRVAPLAEVDVEAEVLGHAETHHTVGQRAPGEGRFAAIVGLGARGPAGGWVAAGRLVRVAGFGFARCRIGARCVGARRRVGGDGRVVGGDRIVVVTAARHDDADHDQRDHSDRRDGSVAFERSPGVVVRSFS